MIKTIFWVMLILTSSALLAQKICLTSMAEAGVPSSKRVLDEDSVLTIPTVVHILFQDSGQWISDEDILKQLAILNGDYRRLNKDREFTPSIFQDVAADCRVEFCLTKRDPAGQSTDGVTRTMTVADEIGLSDRYFQSALGGQDSWDSEQYLNIWVCEISEDGQIAGFSDPPGGDAARPDGVVIDYRFFGIGANALPPFDQGRTLTHEIGHWLGLSHIWGESAGCDTDDGIADTPQQFDRYRQCPDFPQISCGNSNMFMNFMDLTDDHCMNLFTRGQKAVIRQTLLTTRSSLITSIACDPPITAVMETNPVFTVAPNPTSDYVIITTTLTDPQYFLYDLQGIAMPYYKEGDQIFIKHLPAGLYVIIVQSDKTFYLQKFVKMP